MTENIKMEPPKRSIPLRPRSIFTIVFLVCSMLIPACNAETKLWVLWGQSNMGVITQTELQSLAQSGVSLEVPENVIYYADYDYQPSLVRYFNYSDQPEVAGPEVGFVPPMVQWNPSETNVVLKVFRNGSDMSRWAKGGDLYQLLLARINDIRDAHGPLKIMGFFGCQGETDGNDQNAAQLYMSRMQSMISGMRADLGTPLLPFFITQTYTPYPFSRYVGFSQLKLTRSPDIWLVPTVGFTKREQGIHFDAMSDYSLGYYMLCAWVRSIY